MVIKWKELIGSLFINLGIGAVIRYLTNDSIAIDKEFVKPPFTPPGWIFPIVWTILYILMGISAYMIYVLESDIKEKQDALRVYGIQLFLNFIWTLAFFRMQVYLLAFIILIMLWFAIYIMIERFSAINIIAGKLQVPYLLWVMFAGYLNLAIICLNN